MRRTRFILPAALMLLAFVPASALARHHHGRHHARARHARIERFGRDATSTPTSSSSTADAGTVQSFSNGVLMIMLADHSLVSGAVTGDTELECMASAPSQTIHEEGDGGSGDQSNSGDQSGSGDNPSQGSDDQSSGEDQTGADDQNENQAEDQNEGEMEAGCSTADLKTGAVVREAELSISGSGNVWKNVELGS